MPFLKFDMQHWGPSPVKCPNRLRDEQRYIRGLTDWPAGTERDLSKLLLTRVICKKKGKIRRMKSFSFTSYFMFSTAVLSHSPGVVYYHLLLRRETRIPGVAPFSFRIIIWDLFVHRGQTSYTPTAFGKLWTTPGVRCMKHETCFIIIHDPGMRLGTE